MNCNEWELIWSSAGLSNTISKGTVKNNIPASWNNESVTRAKSIGCKNGTCGLLLHPHHIYGTLGTQNYWAGLNFLY